MNILYLSNDTSFVIKSNACMTRIGTSFEIIYDRLLFNMLDHESNFNLTGMVTSCFYLRDVP